MNKLTALHKLASAYFYLYPLHTAPNEAVQLLYEKFHQIRHSMLLSDLEPQPNCTEGFNPKGPTHL